MSQIFAHEVDYWKTGSKRSPAQWIELTIKQIRDHGGTNVFQAVGEQGKREAFLIQFTLGGEQYKIVWPVLPLPNYMDSEANKRAARVQAATTLYHDVKSRCVAAARYGNAIGFFQFKMLPDGRTVQQIATHELLAGLPAIMAGQPPRLAHEE